ncbi:hypothetical protein DPMN_001495 [Dreissena polymorpha]|uniref:Uncharacterized protein n=1 Tax=Dreissena polymorpha TaxID=45954 RepID=A0A9D4RSZ0_DREPO|nr:hypothetical protein DPMN_001495 [Dreissena polymorpha]
MYWHVSLTSLTVLIGFRIRMCGLKFVFNFHRRPLPVRDAGLINCLVLINTVRSTMSSSNRSRETRSNASGISSSGSS